MSNGNGSGRSSRQGSDEFNEAEYYQSIYEMALQNGGLPDEESINQLAAQLYLAEEESRKASALQQQQISQQRQLQQQQQQQQEEENNSGMTRARQEQIENTVAGIFGGGKEKK